MDISPQQKSHLPAGPLDEFVQRVLANSLLARRFPSPVPLRPQEEPIQVGCHGVQDHVHHQTASKCAVPVL